MAIRTHPSYATAHENLGDIYAKMASQAYDKALAARPQQPTGRANEAVGLIRGALPGSARPPPRPRRGSKTPTPAPTRSRDRPRRQTGSAPRRRRRRVRRPAADSRRRRKAARSSGRPRARAATQTAPSQSGRQACTARRRRRQRRRRPRAARRTGPRPGPPTTSTATSPLRAGLPDAQGRIAQRWEAERKRASPSPKIEVGSDIAQGQIHDEKPRHRDLSRQHYVGPDSIEHQDAGWKTAISGCIQQERVGS